MLVDSKFIEESQINTIGQCDFFFSRLVGVSRTLMSISFPLGNFLTGILYLLFIIRLKVNLKDKLYILNA